MTEKIGKCHDCTAPQTEVNMLSRHILELQADKGRLTDSVRELEEKLANADYQLEGRDLEIKELKGLKDVATLIRANNDTVTTLIQLNNMLVSKNQQLTKAKELLNEFLDFESSCMERGIYISDKIRAEAEQFISEVVE